MEENKPLKKPLPRRKTVGKPLPEGKQSREMIQETARVALGLEALPQ